MSDKLPCSNCGEKFDTSAEFQRHECGVKYHCRGCPMWYLRLEQLATHVSEKHSGMMCGHCSYECGTADEMDEHLKTCSRVDQPPTVDDIVRNFAVLNADGTVTFKEDAINPSHYKSSKSKCLCGRTIECIDVVRHHNMNIGNVIKYLWRSDHKGERQEQLKKAHWYLRDEIRKLEPEFNAND